MGPLVPRPAVTMTLFILLGFLGANIWFDGPGDPQKTYDGSVTTLALCGLIAGILGFELAVGLIRRGRDDL